MCFCSTTGTNAELCEGANTVFVGDYSLSLCDIDVKLVGWLRTGKRRASSGAIAALYWQLLFATLLMQATAPSLLDIKGSFLAPPGRLQCVVSIQIPGSHEHVCSGTLIDPRWVLTAAHCVDPESQYSAGPRGIVHIGGTHVDDRNSTVEVMMADGAIIHNKWTEDKDQRSPFNLALLKLPHSSRHPVPEMLQDHVKLDTGQMLVAAGWGPGGDGPALGEAIFGSLKIEPQQFIASEQCNRTTLWNGSIQEDTVCGINDQRSASCVVDSGSPLLLLDTPKYEVAAGTPTLDFLVGINIDGASCGTNGKPDVYIDVRRHASWIQEKCQSSHIEL